MITASSPADTFGLPINESIAFSNSKGDFKEGLKRRQLKTLKRFVAPLEQFLEPGEEVHLALRGISPESSAEAWIPLFPGLGLITLFIRRCVLVITDRRILHFPVKGDYSPRHSIAQIRFGDLDTSRPVVCGAWGLTVRYRNGTQEGFLLSHRESPKPLPLLTAIRMRSQEPTAYGIRHHLCPRCTAPLTIGEYLCPSCGLEFKNERTARTFSILLPGGGYFYTGHPIVGFGDASIDTILIAMVLSPLVNLATRTNALSWVVLFGVILCLKKLHAVYESKRCVREYVPVDREIQPRRP